ncbi:hypothetical protein, partial [Glutamicibacter sp. BW78]|uniref:hypothetical protein n=1 Tax=Glutamicibacter sp. BW78 TaxID=2024403 RepID=UPI0013041A4A
VRVDDPPAEGLFLRVCARYNLIAEQDNGTDWHLSRFESLFGNVDGESHGLFWLHCILQLLTRKVLL